MTYKSPYGGWSAKELVFNDVRHMMNWRRKWLGSYQFDLFKVTHTSNLKQDEVEELKAMGYLTNENDLLASDYHYTRIMREVRDTDTNTDTH